MNDTADKDKGMHPLALFEGMGGIHPEGGLISMMSNSLMFEDATNELIDRFNITTADGLIATALSCEILQGNSCAHSLLQYGIYKGLITKENLIRLYMMQDREKREQRPFLTLNNIWDILCGASRGAKTSESTQLIINVTKEDIVSIANTVITVHASDMKMFFGQWFYRDAQVPFSEDFLLHWYKEMGKLFHSIEDGKVASLIAIAMYQKYPSHVSLHEIMKRFLALSRKEPESHGIYRYISLALQMAERNEDEKKIVIDAWVQSIINTLEKGYSRMQDAEMSLHILLEEITISQEEKKVAMGKINMYCTEQANHLTSFVHTTSQRK